MAKKAIKSVAHNDGWMSLITGLGTDSDKRTTNRVQWTNHDQEFYEQLYSGDELASRIVDIVPEDALRKPLEFLGYEKTMLEKVEDKCDELDLRGSCERAWKWGRATGGALQYIVTDTDDPSSPLQPGEKVLALRELSRYDLRILTTDIETDFGSINFGKPNIYYLNVQVGTNVKLYPLHWTRTVRYDGKMVPRRTYIRNNYWHDSILQRLYNVIRNYQTSNDAAASILQDFNVGIYKMKDLINYIANGKEQMVKDRIELLNYSKSTINAMILDTDNEDFVDLSRNITGLAEMLEHQAKRFVAATEIPHTKLLGESPDGSNATGNSTSQMWYEYIESEQHNYARLKIKTLLKVVFYDMPELNFKFKPLAQLTELEQGELRNKQAQTDQIYLETGVLDASEVAESRFGGEQYSTETALDEEGRASGLVVPGVEEEEPGDDSDPSGGGNPPGSFKLPSEKKDAELTGLSLPPLENPALSPLDPEEGSGNEFPSTPEQDKKDDETAGTIPASLEPNTPNANGVEAPRRGTNNWSMRNNEMPGDKPAEKVKPFISQTESLPFRDPKTDPKLKPPGLPNKPRVIDYTGEGAVAQTEMKNENKRTDSKADWECKECGHEGTGKKPATCPKCGARGSCIKMDGAVDPVKDIVLPQTASIVVRHGDMILMGRRRDSGKLTLPGGHGNDGEHPLETAKRELFEETGIKGVEPQPIRSHTIQKDAKDETKAIQVHTFSLDVDSKFATAKYDPDKEVTSWKWYPVKNGILPTVVTDNLHHNPNVALEDLGLVRGKNE